ncbi:MAG: hypothetical protein HFH11_10070 [Dorea sp.]|jgi:thymidine kinase|nr:hypothetical protein [Dorea sp.]MCI9271477.1 hypothetical protein [Dorea sp.]
MVNLLTGPKGSGKTQKMMDLANEQVKACKGNLVFLKNSHRDTRNVGFSIRVVCMDDYPAITNTDGYIGFLYGMYSANHDLECVFIDGLMKQAEFSLDKIPVFIARLKQLSAECGVDFYVSLSAKQDDLTDEAFQGCNFIA